MKTKIQELREKFKQETGNKIVNYIHPLPVYRDEYVEWLENIVLIKEEIEELQEVKIEELESKAKKWDDLDDQISEFYECDEDGNTDPEKDFALDQIGEIAAIAFGYL